MISKQKKYTVMTMTVLRLVWRLIVLSLTLLVAIASDKPARPRYTALRAQELYEDGLINEADYGRAIYRND